MTHIPAFSSDPALNRALAPLAADSPPPRRPTLGQPVKGSTMPPDPVLEWDPEPKTKQDAVDQLARAKRRAERLFTFALANAHCGACTRHQAGAREIVLRFTGRTI